MNACALSELKTLACHHKIVARLKEILIPIDKAKSNHNRWGDANFKGELSPNLAEWQTILETKN